jgi:hypothetical protein
VNFTASVMLLKRLLSLATILSNFAYSNIDASSWATSPNIKVSLIVQAIHVLEYSFVPRNFVGSKCILDNHVGKLQQQATDHY